jgi:hypothetical protein
MQNKTMSSPQSGSPNAWPAVGSRLIRAMVACLALVSTAFSQTGSFDWNSTSRLGAYSGIKRASITVTSPRRMVINCLQIDTRAPWLRFYTTPAGGSLDTLTQTTRQFINASQSSNKKLVAAVNATPWSGTVTWNSSVPANLIGLAVSEGSLVSAAENRVAPTFVMSKMGRPLMAGTSTGVDIADMRTAAAGFDFVLTNGVPVVGETALAPRTGIGLSRDERYVFFMTIDGRQTASAGATYDDVGGFLRFFGAWTGINMDGGGSTTLAWWNPSTSSSQLLNVPVGGGFSVPSERHNANNLGVYFESDRTVVSWSMNQTGGNASDGADPLLDGSNPGVLSGPGSYVAGPSGLGNALALVGGGSMSATVTGALFTSTQQITMSAWINLGDVDQRGRYLMSLSGPDGSIRIDGDGFLRAGFNTSAGLVEAVGTTHFSQYLGKWTHVAATLAGGTLSLWVDGRRVASTTRAGAQLSATGSCVFGIGQIPDQAATRFHGAIDEVRLMNAAASQSEVVALAGLTTLTTTYGTASASVPVIVSGSGVTAGILVTPPAGCEVSTDNVNFSPTVTVGSSGTVPNTTVHVRLAARAPAGSGFGNIEVISAGTATVTPATLATIVWPLPLTGTFTAASKAYDGTTFAVVTGRSLSGQLSGDDVNLAGGNGAFFNPNVGQARTVNLEGAGLTGAHASNYTLVAVSPATADINGTGRFAETFSLFAPGEYLGPGNLLPGWNSMTQSNGLLASILDVGGGNLAYQLNGTGGGASCWTAYATPVLDANTPRCFLSGTIRFIQANRPGFAWYGDGWLTLADTPDDPEAGNYVRVGFSRSAFNGDADSSSWSRPVISWKLAGVAGSQTYSGPMGALRDFPGDPGIFVRLSRTAPGTIELFSGSPRDGDRTMTQNFTGAQAAALDTLRYVGAGNYWSAYQFDNIELTAGAEIMVAGAPVAMRTTYGTASESTSFTVSGLNMTSGILVTPPAGFEVSTDNTNFASTVTVGSNGTIPISPVYVRLAANASAGSKGGNIVLSSGGASDVVVATAISTVDPKAVNGSFTASNKVYDGTTAAAVTARSLSGIVGSDDVSLSGGAATFADAAIGTGKTVSLTGAVLAGGQAGNYTLASVATTTADIRAAGVSENFENYALGDYPSPANPLPGWKYMLSNEGLIPTITSKINGQALNMNGGAAAWMSVATPVLAPATPNWAISADARYLASNNPGNPWYGQGGLLLSSIGDMTADYLWVGIESGWGEFNSTTTFARPWAQWRLGGVTGGGTLFTPVVNDNGAIRMSTDTWGPAVLTVSRTNSGSSLSFVIDSPVDGPRTATLSFSGPQAAALNNLQYVGFANYLSVWQYDNLVVTGSPTPPIETWLDGQPLNEENLLKYGIGGAVTIQSSSEAPTSSLDAEKLALTAIVRTDDSDLQVVAETSGNLTDWNTSGIIMEAAANQNGVATGFQRRVFSIPLTNNPTRSFLRLRVLYLP